MERGGVMIGKLTGLLGKWDQQKGKRGRTDKGRNFS